MPEGRETFSKVEVEVKSRTRSICTGRCYGRARVLKAWGLPRSAFFQRRRLHTSPRPPVRRGPKTHYTDEQLTGEIRRTIRTLPFHGEGYRKVWARPRLAGVRTSLRRVLRQRRQHELLAPQWQPQPVEPKGHEVSIVTVRTNQMWGIDATDGFTLGDGQVSIFAMISHCPASCLGIHVANRDTRFEALELVRQAVRVQFGGCREGIALGATLRHDHGSKCRSNDFQREIRFLGMESSPAFAREPEGNGCTRTPLPHPQGAASLGAPHRDSGRTGRSARRIPPELQRTVAIRTVPLPIPPAGSSVPPCP